MAYFISDLFMHRFTNFISFILIAVGVFTADPANAQNYSREWSAGIHSGLLVFYGDIKTNDFLPAISGFNELRAGGGIQATYHLNPVLGLRASLLAGKLAGASPDNDEYFNANIIDYTLQAMISLNTLVFYDYDKTPIDIYAVVGYGLVEFRTMRRRLSDDSFIRAFGYSADGSKTPKKTRELVIPVGLKIHSNMANLFGLRNFSNSEITLEFMLHNANTNKLDANLTVREVRDKYSYLALGILYYF